MDFLNKNQKVYIAEEEKKVFLEKLKRDVEVMGWGAVGSGFVSLFCSPQGNCPFTIQGNSSPSLWVLCM